MKWNKREKDLMDAYSLTTEFEIITLKTSGHE